MYTKRDVEGKVVVSLLLVTEVELCESIKIYYVTVDNKLEGGQISASTVQSSSIENLLMLYKADGYSLDSTFENTIKELN